MSTEATPRKDQDQAQPSPEDVAAEQRVAAYLARPHKLPVAHFDAQGRLLPLDPEEDRRRAEAIPKMLERWRNEPDDDPPDALEQMMRGIDENRPPGQKMFEGMY
jgi:hypothetical protein